MKILVLADCESKSLYEYFTPEKLEGVELILACGDLKESYLDFCQYDQRPGAVCHGKPR